MAEKGRRNDQMGKDRVCDLIIGSLKTYASHYLVSECANRNQRSTRSGRAGDWSQIDQPICYDDLIGAPGSSNVVLLHDSKPIGCQACMTILKFYNFLNTKFIQIRRSCTVLYLTCHLEL